MINPFLTCAVELGEHLPTNEFARLHRHIRLDTSDETCALKKEVEEEEGEREEEQIRE